MVSKRDIERTLAREPVEILFYLVVEKSGERMLKPLKYKGSLSLGLIRAILDNTISPSFYQTLSDDLTKKGIESGSTVQLRAKFSANHALFDSQLKGTKILCEVKI